jgi:hypothetical protein
VVEILLSPIKIRNLTKNAASSLLEIATAYAAGILNASNSPMGPLNLSNTPLICSPRWYRGSKYGTIGVQEDIQNQRCPIKGLGQKTTKVALLYQGTRAGQQQDSTMSTGNDFNECMGEGILWPRGDDWTGQDPTHTAPSLPLLLHTWAGASNAGGAETISIFS